MNIIFVIVAAFPMGYLIRRRSVAVVAFLAADSFLFTFQTLNVLLGWMAAEDGIGGAQAFGEFPIGLPLEYSNAEVAGYGAVNTALLLIGIGLTVLGGAVRSRRGRRSPEAITVS